MAILPAIGLLLAATWTAQEPPDIPGLWGDEPSKAVEIKDPDAEAAEEKRLLSAVAAAERRGIEDSLLAVPLEDLGVHYLYRKRSADAEPLLRRALAIREKSQGPEHPDVASTLTILAGCEMVGKQKKAKGVEPMLRRALAIREKQGKDSAEVAQVLRYLGGFHMVRKDFDAAEAEFARALAIRERIAPDSEGTARILNDLGILYTMRASTPPKIDLTTRSVVKLLEDWPSERLSAKAEQFLKRALAIREKLLDRDDHQIAGTLYDLMQLALIRERIQEAVPYAERWLKLRETAGPPSKQHRYVYNMLAVAADERKDFDASDRWHAKEQEIVAKLHGPESHEIAITLAWRADTAIQAGRFDDAEAFLKQALEIETALIGADDPAIVRARDLMSGSYRDHVEDRKAPVIWNRLQAFADEDFKRHRHRALRVILENDARLLQKTNRVLPGPTEEDLAYLVKIEAVFPTADIEYLTTCEEIFDTSFGKRRLDLDDEALSHIARMYGLEKLELNGYRTNVTDAGLAHLSNLVGLRVLMLPRGHITDAGLAHLAGLENLEELVLAGIHVSDAGLVQLAGLENLKELDLRATGLKGPGLVHLKGMKKLRSLDLRYTDIDDAGLAHLEELTGLRELELVRTRVTPAAVKRLQHALPDLDIDYEPRPDLNVEYQPLRD